MGDRHVSIHAPWEGCDEVAAPVDGHNIIVSIHAPWEGCDSAYQLWLYPFLKFQFTHPGKGATVWCKVAYYRADKQA